MGYRTDFDGKINIVPELCGPQIEEIETFCKKRHNHNTSPSVWCDWEIVDEGHAIAWNGGEKSYEMERWMVYLIQNFLQGHTLNGIMSAQGEDAADMWLLHVRDNTVLVEELVAQPSGTEHIIGGGKRVLPDQKTQLAIAPPVVQSESAATVMNPSELADHFHGYLKDLAGDAPEEAASIFRTIFDGTPITVNEDGTFSVDLDA